MNNLISKLEQAFSSRSFDRNLEHYIGLPGSDREMIENLLSISEGDLNCEQLEENSDAFYLLIPKDFCFYIQKAFIASLKEDSPGILVNYIVVNMLDRSPRIDYWDSFFVDRWKLFSFKELSAVLDWLMWLSSQEIEAFEEGAIDRAFDTVNLLIDEVNKPT